MEFLYVKVNMNKKSKVFKNGKTFDQTRVENVVNSKTWEKIQEALRDEEAFKPNPVTVCAVRRRKTSDAVSFHINLDIW